MNLLSQYVLDTSVFIEAAKNYYSFDFGTKFWDFLVEKAKENVLMSIDKVLDEINKGKEDEPLRIWCNRDFINYFYKTIEESILNEYSIIVNWAEDQHSQYNRIAIDEFMNEDKADAWIVSYAKANNLIVVTNEVYNPTIKRKIPIPNVCKAFEIRYINIFDMLRNLKFEI